jgi:hypothetical protein
VARARNIKPGVFKNEVLGAADPIYTLLFQGLWLLADRDGLLEDRPVRIKGEVFPYRDGIDMDGALGWLHDNGFILRYQAEGRRCIAVLNFKKHQNPHKKEVSSGLPLPTAGKAHGRRPRTGPDEPRKNRAGPGLNSAGPEIDGTGPEKTSASPADSLLLNPDSLSLDSGLLKVGASPPSDPTPATTGRKFVPPTVEEVRVYCRERNNAVDPERFVAHYSANGWVQSGGQKIKDWKSAVITWEKNNFNNGSGRGSASKPATPSLRFDPERDGGKTLPPAHPGAGRTDPEG